MSNYYSKRDAKVRIAQELMARGWEIKGYKEDQSDSMTDYYSPANWSGIATKNGFILVIDNSYDAESKEITKYNPKGNLSFDDREKIKTLESTLGKWATTGEEENAKNLIEKIQSKTMNESTYEVVGMTLAHLGNPKGSKWHIEKDGKIYDKGTGITKYSDMPSEWEYDINKMEYKEGYKYWGSYGNEPRKEKEISDDLRKVINDFKALILRFERVINSMNSCGDGTKETEQKAQEQQVKAGYEKATVTETKTHLKMIPVNRNYIMVGDYITVAHYGCFWKVVSSHMQKGTWKGVKMEKNAFTYEQVGKESRGYQALKNASRYYDYEDRMLIDVEKGNTKVFELKEVTESIEVEKWVKIDKTKKSYNTTKKTEPGEKQEQSIVTESNETINHEFTITADTDTRDNSSLWVVKIVDKLSTDEYKKVAEQFKALKGYYSKFKHGFIFKYDPTEVLKGEPKQTAEEVTKQETVVNNVVDFEEYKNNNEVENMDNTYNSNDSKVEDIFSKFDNIEINNNSRISENDEEFCKEQEKEYQQFIKFSEDYIQYLESNTLKNSMYDSQSLINEMNTERNNKYCWFINKIVDYFKSTYKVTLTADTIHKKYDITIDYNTIVSEVIEQLGGYEFADKAEKEIKDAFKNTIRNDNIKIKNNKISIESFFYAESYDYSKGKEYSVSYSSDEKFHKLFKAMSHFLFKVNENYFNNLYNTITRKKDDDVFKSHEISNSGIKTLKLYKNGKIDIEFSSTEYTRKFAKEYCGYMEKSA